MRRIVPLFTLALCLVALPVLAADQPAAGGDEPACVNMTPIDSYTMDTLPVENGGGVLETPDPSQQAGCSGWASCAGGGTVTCTGTWSCWGIDDCYAYCDGTYVWCAYRPHPCPV